MATTLSCLHCGDALAPGSRFCAQCGLEVFACAICGTSIGQGEPACPRCGAPVDPDSIVQYSTSQEGSGSPWAEVVQRLQSATLGEFEIGRELGRGAMAAVFLAHDIALDRRVAIKVMSPGLLMGEGMIERFKREAITIAHLNHPNIVSVHSVRQAEGLHFFVMRYIHGRSLEQVIHLAGKLAVPIVRSILCQVGSALTYAHRSGVVHRDIKPANILIDEEGNAVVTDFGIAKVAELPSDTHSGALVGTPAYMSPEQCSGAEVSGASDQYALGAVAYEMLTGHAPFTGSTLTVMQAHVEEPPDPIRELRGDCPPELEAAILRMLAKDPASRWGTMAEAKAALGATPLGEEDPLLAELRRLVTPELDDSAGQRAPISPAPRTRPSIARAAPPAGLVRTITILPPPAALEEGESFALVALVRGEHGVPLPGRAVQWSSEAPGVLRVDPAKQLAFAVAPGSAWLTAACEGIRARLHVQVAPAMADELEIQSSGAVASIQISTPPKSVKVGDSFVLTATPLDYRGDSLPDQPVLWNTSDVGVAVVTAIGWVTTLGPGSVVLTATCKAASASVTVNVEKAATASRRMGPAPAKPRNLPAPTEHRPARRRRGSRTRRRLSLAAVLGVAIAAALLSRSGGVRKLGIYPSRKPATLATVSNLPTPVSPPDSVAAILRGAPASVTITRRPRRTMLPGTSTRMSAEVRDIAGRTLPRATIGWSSSNPRVVRVDSTGGWLRAVGPGRALLVAASGEWRDSALIVVQRPSAGPPGPASLSIAPHGSLRVGDTATLAASVFDATGAPLSDAEVTWSSSEPRVATVDPKSGRVHGYAAGTALVIANSGSQSAMSLLTVIPADHGDTLGLEAYAPETAGLKQPEETAIQSKGTSSEPDAERRQLEALIMAEVGQCYEAVRSKDLARVAEMYRPATRSDQDQLKKLSRILRTPEWEAVVSERVDGAPQFGTDAAAMEFTLQLKWKDASGRLLTSRPLFRVEFGRRRNEWELSSCRIVGSPEL
jgi:eukaryotic-like serine/threonine-protein kinase